MEAIEAYRPHPGDSKIAKLRQQVQQLQNQVVELQGGGHNLQIGRTVGEGNALANRGRYSEAEAKYKEALTLISQHLSQKRLTDKVAAVFKAHVLTKMGLLNTKKEYSAADSQFRGCQTA